MTSHAMPRSAASSLRNRAVTLSHSLKVGTTTDNSGVVAACDEVPCPGRMASFMRQRISPGAGHAKARGAKDRPDKGKTGQKQVQKCQRPRTTGARTSGAANYSVV